MATYSLQTNITNNATNCSVFGSSTGLSPVTYDVALTTQSGSYLFNDLWVKADVGYEFTSINDLSYEVDGITHTIGTNGVSAILDNGQIHIVCVKQVPPNTIINLTITGTPVQQPSGIGEDGGTPPIDPLAGSGVGSTGYSYTFNGNNQSILIRNNSNFDSLNAYDDWSVSFFANIPSEQPGTGSEQLIVTKNAVFSYPNDAGIIVSQNGEASAYPFKIGVYTIYGGGDAGKVFFETSDGIVTTRLTSSATYNDGLYRQYTFNKTGSTYEMWVNADCVASQSVSYTSTNNQHDILIGNNTYSGSSAFSGSIDEFRIRRSALSESEIISLSDTDEVTSTFLQKKYAGYVFYKDGIIVITDPRERYQNMFLGDGNWDYTNKPFQLNYRATKTIEEISILCELNMDEFNVSSNPSLRLTSNQSDPRLKPMVTGSDFRPYVTQIGLYNDSGDLLAIAKLGSPLKKRQDVDVTINVKFDID